MNSTIQSFKPENKDFERLGSFSAVPPIMNQTVTEGFGVNQMAAEFEIAAHTTARASQ